MTLQEIDSHIVSDSPGHAPTRAFVTLVLRIAASSLRGRARTWFPTKGFPSMSTDDVAVAVAADFFREGHHAKPDQGDDFEMAAERLVRDGRLAKKPDADYFRQHMKTIRYWNGSAWVSYEELSPNRPAGSSPATAP